MRYSYMFTFYNSQSSPKFLFRIFTLLLLVIVVQVSSAQNKQIAAINNYVNFSNECVHGMLIVHRLLENFNQDVNKFVNLESHQVNFYSNKDLPKNIFEDPDSWFFERSPKLLLQDCKSTAGDLIHRDAVILNSIANEMNSIIDEINEIRFRAEKQITEEDLNVRENQEKIYAILEEGVQLFEDFYVQYVKLQTHINLLLEENPDWNTFLELRATHLVIQQMLHALRTKEDNNWDMQLHELWERMNNLRKKGQLDEKIDKVMTASASFLKTANVPQEYKLYGKYYYYHNSNILNLVNRYGNGYVNNTNNKIKNEGLALLEIPHFYQVIYPSRWIEDVPLASKDPMIVDIPMELKEREIVVSDRTILVDNAVVTLELYDHKMIDGDIVSVNFNGDWILENYKLKGKPYKIDIKLNDVGKNFLLLHAENLGERPPNTMALKYTSKGKEELVVLSSNLDESELIEIKINP